MKLSVTATLLATIAVSAIAQPPNVTPPSEPSALESSSASHGIHHHSHLQQNPYPGAYPPPAGVDHGHLHLQPLSHANSPYPQDYHHNHRWYPGAYPPPAGVDHPVQHPQGHLHPQPLSHSVSANSQNPQDYHNHGRYPLHSSAAASGHELASRAQHTGPSERRTATMSSTQAAQERVPKNRRAQGAARARAAKAARQDPEAARRRLEAARRRSEAALRHSEQEDARVAALAREILRPKEERR